MFASDDEDEDDDDSSSSDSSQMMEVEVFVRELCILFDENPNQAQLTIRATCIP